MIGYSIYERCWQQILREGIENGEFRPDLDIQVTSYGMLGMLNWSYKWYAPKADEIPPERMAKLLCQVFLEGLNSPISTKDGMLT